jgi:hypothetical protein
MTRSTKNSISSDEPIPLSSNFEQQVAGLEHVMQDISTRLTLQTSRMDEVESQLGTRFQQVTNAISALIEKIDKCQPNTASIPPNSPSRHLVWSVPYQFIPLRLISILMPAILTNHVNIHFKNIQEDMMSDVL